VGFEPTVDFCPRRFSSLEQDEVQGVTTHSDMHICPSHLSVLLGAVAEKLSKAAPDLSAILSAWPDLPEQIRAAIVTMVQAAKKEGK